MFQCDTAVLLYILVRPLPPLRADVILVAHVVVNGWGNYTESLAESLGSLAPFGIDKETYRVLTYSRRLYWVRHHRIGRARVWRTKTIEGPTQRALAVPN